MGAAANKHNDEWHSLKDWGWGTAQPTIPETRVVSKVPIVMLFRDPANTLHTKVLTNTPVMLHDVIAVLTEWLSAEKRRYVLQQIQELTADTITESALFPTFQFDFDYY